MENKKLFKVQISQPRLPRMKVGATGINAFYRIFPPSAAWWSAALPGCGQLLTGYYLRGFIFMFGEIMCNLLGNINLSLFYTATGQFHKVHSVINYNWALGYAVLFIYSIADAYQIAVELNKYVDLEENQTIRNLEKAKVTAYELNALDIKVPIYALIWSLLCPGLGHLYIQRFFTGYIFLAWFMAISIFTNLPYLLIYTFTGQFDLIPDVVNYEWLLFLPSIYLFSAYDAYSLAVHINQLFKEEQLYYLNGKYGKSRFLIHTSQKK